jgi:hypothetical protein
LQRIGVSIAAKTCQHDIERRSALDIQRSWSLMGRFARHVPIESQAFGLESRFADRPDKDPMFHYS